MSVDKKDLITTRDRLPADTNFILATWLRGLRYGNDWFELIEPTAYFETYHKVIESLLAKPEVKVLVSCLKDDPEIILGYSVFEGPRLHWVFVKKPWRMIGIAKSIVPVETSIATHVTVIGRSIMQKHKVVFNPFL